MQAASTVSADPPRQAPPQQRPGLILSFIAGVLKVIGLLFMSLLASIIMEYIGLIWFWPEQGWHHSYAMLDSELTWLSSHFKNSLIVEQPGAAMLKVLTRLEEWLIERTGLAHLDARAGEISQSDSFWAWVGGMYVLTKDYILAAVYTTMTFAVRLAVLTLAAPLFLLATLTGLVDGLMRRDLRKFGAGRESSFIYHRAKRSLIPLMFMPWIVYLSLPISVNPLWVLLPCASLLGIMVAITASTFKKYL